jgi:hypothetical protein
MNAYEMIMRAADNIERYPGRFNFQVTRLPQNEHDPACYLGEMLRVLGVTKGVNVGDFTQSMLGLKEGAFFEELAKIHGGGVPVQFDPNDARVGVPLLRKFAKRYEGIPDEVRAIFDIGRPPFKVVWTVTPPMPKGAFYNIATDSYEMAPA